MSAGVTVVSPQVTDCHKNVAECRTDVAQVSHTCHRMSPPCHGMSRRVADVSRRVTASRNVAGVTACRARVTRCRRVSRTCRRVSRPCRCMSRRCRKMSQACHGRVTGVSHGVARCQTGSTLCHFMSTRRHGDIDSSVWGVTLVSGTGSPETGRAQSAAILNLNTRRPVCSQSPQSQSTVHSHGSRDTEAHTHTPHGTRPPGFVSCQVSCARGVVAQAHTTLHGTRV